VAGISLSLLRSGAETAEIERMGEAVLDGAQTISRRLAPGEAYGADRLGLLSARHGTAALAKPLAAVAADEPR